MLNLQKQNVFNYYSERQGRRGSKRSLIHRKLWSSLTEKSISLWARDRANKINLPNQNNQGQMIKRLKAAILIKTHDPLSSYLSYFTPLELLAEPQNKLSTKQTEWLS